MVVVVIRQPIKRPAIAPGFLVLDVGGSAEKSGYKSGYKSARLLCNHFSFMWLRMKFRESMKR